MSDEVTYVNINGEVSAGKFEWAHHPRLVWLQVVPVGLLGAAVLGGIAGAIAHEEDATVWLWAVLVGLLGGLVFGGLTYYMAASRMELKDGVLRASMGQKKVNIPMGAIAYIGRAEFNRGNRWRASRVNMVVEAGPGIEIVSRDRKYITVNTRHADAVFQALLQQGLHPDTLRVPFPEQAVTVRKGPDHREPRGAQA